jgi:hypothetical protein
VAPTRKRFRPGPVGVLSAVVPGERDLGGFSKPNKVASTELASSSSSSAVEGHESCFDKSRNGGRALLIFAPSVWHCIDEIHAL